MAYLPQRSKKSLSRVINFEKFMTSIGWLGSVRMLIDTSNIGFDEKSRKKLHSPLQVGKKVLALAERLWKKDAPGNLYKSATKNMSFFNREQILIVREVVPRDDSHDYWISKMEVGEIIDKRFLRQKLFALKNQFE